MIIQELIFPYIGDTELYFRIDNGKIENKEVPDEIINLLDENGLFKERNSWGVIKKYFRLDGNPNYTPGDKMSELGKTLKNLWKNEFV